ncbi:MAG: E3 binding domain-containing protein, partial [Spirochaetia bacterium]|nr:E3 binding domain-containing protein [Spirochaetia bacterium]
MAFLFKLPELGEGVMEGELVKWHVREGEALRRDQIVAEVMTDKAAIEVPFPQTEGRVVKLLAREGDLIKIGADVMEYEGEAPLANDHGAAPTSTSSASVDSPKSPQKNEGHPAKQKSTTPPAPLQRATGEHVKASPAVRHRAHELGLSLDEISPSREDGRIVLSDLEKSLRRRLSHSAPGLPERVHVYDLEGDERKPLVGLRKAVLKQMVQSKRTIPHFSYMEEMDASVLVKRRS